MHRSSDQEAYGPGHLTFDCPWCGAICGVAPDHVGESFECPECGQKTKLTEHTVRRAGLLDAPPDAPHHEEQRVAFDCPWCGNTAPVSADLFGTSYNCPRCHQSTRLTTKTTRRPGAAEPGAPAVAAPARRWPLLAVAVVAAAVVGVVFATQGGGEGGSADDARAKTPAGVGTPTGTDETPRSVPSRSSSDASGPTPLVPAPETGPTPLPGPDGEAIPPAVDPKVVAARARLDQARRALEEAKAALARWDAAHPDAEAERARQTAREALLAELAKGVDRLRLQGLDPASARAFDETFAGQIAPHPEQVAVVESVLAALAHETPRPPPVGAWREAPFHVPFFLDTLRRQVEQGRGFVDPQRTRLAVAVARAEREEAAAAAAPELSDR